MLATVWATITINANTRNTVIILKYFKVGKKENKITTTELNKRLSWTLEQKIFHSLETIDVFMGVNPAYVSYSGGKDSTILLYLSRIIKKDIRAIFFNTTNEFPEMYRFLKNIDGIEWVQPEMNLKQVIEKFGFPLISKEQSQYLREYRHAKSEKHKYLRLNGRPDKPYQGKISNKWQHLINAPFEISEKCCYYLKKKPAIKFEKETGLKPIIGTSVNESTLRKQKYLVTGCNSFDTKRIASYPLSIWTEENKWDFIRKNKIPYCGIYDKGETQTGCMVCGFGCQYDDRFERLKEIEPKAYKTAMELTNNGVTYYDAIQMALKKPKCEGKNILKLWD